MALQWGTGTMPNRLIVERTTRIESPVEAVWQWHVRPGAFERLTPPWEKVRVLERTGGIENGARVVLEVKVGPVPSAGWRCTATSWRAAASSTFRNRGPSRAGRTSTR